MYGGATGIIVGLFQMTPENANGSGCLLPGVCVPAPPAASDAAAAAAAGAF